MIKLKPKQTYEEYIEHQKTKLEKKKEWITVWDKQHQIVLAKRLGHNSLIKKDMNVVCLGARLGGEVRAFKNVGCRAIGIDLNPGENNPNVIQGDFHNTGLGTATFDIVYCNCLDHVFNIGDFINEVVRLLKQNGVFILEVLKVDGVEPDDYAKVWWSKTDDVLLHFIESKLKLVDTTWYEEQRNHNTQVKQFCFRRV